MIGFLNILEVAVGAVYMKEVLDGTLLDVSNTTERATTVPCRGQCAVWFIADIA